MPYMQYHYIYSDLELRSWRYRVQKKSQFFNKNYRFYLKITELRLKSFCRQADQCSHTKLRLAVLEISRSQITASEVGGGVERIHASRGMPYNNRATPKPALWWWPVIG